MKYITPLFLICCISFSSCKFFEKENTENALARVHDAYLYKDDLGDLITKLEGDKDSARIIGNYIQNWIQQQLLLEKADLNLTEDQKNFQKLLEDYRTSLIIYAFQKEWIRQKLDTSVNAQEIEEYYENNQANFELKENIVKMRFAKVAKNAPKLDKLEKLIKLSDKDSRTELRDYFLQYAIDYNDNDSIWVTLDKVTSKIPLNIENEETFLQQNKFLITADSANYYLLYINDYKIKSTLSPLSFEREKIRNIIVNQRKLSLIADMKSDLFETAMKKGNAEIY